MRYLKTYFSASHEMKFLRLNYLESKGHVDRFIICEFNRTHTGAERELIWQELKNDYFSEEELKDIIYIGADISKYTTHSMTDGNIIHRNERYMRGYFVREVDLRGSDVVISVDADEVIFGPSYEEIVPKLSFFKRGYQVNLRRFMYKINYHWIDEPFVAPMICRADYYWGRFPSQWRYDGAVYPGTHGCHFSWCMSVPEMVDKMKRFSHAQDYPELADPAKMQEAVDRRTYPFEPDRRFKIETVDLFKQRDLFPAALFDMLDRFHDDIVAVH